MAEVLAVVNQKGGVSKSTTAQIIGDALTLRGQRVLFVDLDSQGNLSYALGVTSPSMTVYDVLSRAAPISDAIITTGQGDLLPADQRLALIDQELAQRKRPAYVLQEALRPVLSRYDEIVLDTPPVLGYTVINALTAAHRAVIPVRADVFSLQGLAQLANTVETVKGSTNPELVIAGILMQQYNSRTVLSRQITDMVASTAKRLGTKVFSATIRDATAIREAQALQDNLLTYAKRSKVAGDMQAFISELFPDKKG